ncbi:uncharacterized protein C8Q71DRAFT_855184 [Rhodofomes roseus]|uniref:Uncharacterized protein n=1 Tax=Rhodofomes roseus TaxID=34475 RepID=A0ABQ8KN87_9APHY|nr:uncharacterized protein C8Q71DRAFT_855184 [Rhodofomes roseus]KAH9839877.1 hypothetical protein C8Q71DRAFT_855184 [Rhodofomes roseus]
MGHTDGRATDDAFNQESVATSARTTYICAKILSEHLQKTARRLPHDESRKLIEGLTYTSAIPVSDSNERDGESHDPQAEDQGTVGTALSDSQPMCSSHPSLLGGLSEQDVKRFGASSLRLTPRCQEQLAHELKDTLLSVTDFISDLKAGPNGLEAASQVPDRIRAQGESLERERKLSEMYQEHISQLVSEINQIHPRLEEDLIEALSVLPSILNDPRTAEAALLSTTIEASLIKLSLIRTRTHVALYGHSSPSRPNATMSRALATAAERLRAKQRTQEEEERELDGQLAAYDGMLSLVGGKDGSFAQVVEDMARVKRETEECRKDLRRLGWTGD